MRNQTPLKNPSENKNVITLKKKCLEMWAHCQILRNISRIGNILLILIINDESLLTVITSGYRGHYNKSANFVKIWVSRLKTYNKNLPKWKFTNIIQQEERLTQLVAHPKSRSKIPSFESTHMENNKWREIDCTSAEKLYTWTG